MKKFLILFGIFALAVVLTPPVFADTANICSKTCQVSEDCSDGYSCYVGVCRKRECPSSPTCACNSQVVGQIATSPKENTVSPTSAPKASPVASSGKQIVSSPKTGFSVVEMTWTAFGLVGGGLYLKAMARKQQ